MARVYAAAAVDYRTAGWTGVLPLPPRRKKEPPKGFTGEAGADPSDADIARWINEAPEGNVALRMPDGVIGLDVDAYKPAGAESYAALVAKCGPLPATWTSTSRSDEASGIRLYRVPPGMKLQGAPKPGIEIIQHHHRYAVVAPSIHPETGQEYRWISPTGEVRRNFPSPSDVPDLPEAWIAQLREPVRCAGDRSHQPRFTEEWATAVKVTLSDALAQMGPGGRHDAALKAAMALVRYETLGYPGAVDALETLGRTFRAEVAADRGGPREAAREWDSIVDSARDKVASTPNTAKRWEDTDEWWERATSGAGQATASTAEDAEAGDAQERPAPDIDDVVRTFRRWLYLADDRPLLAVLGTVTANNLDGEPVWILVVGPPGGGKTEQVMSTSHLPYVHPAGTITEAALLSGTSKRERAAQAKGGLLRAIGEFGIILAKDFGSVLSMNRDARASVLAALREIYDGSWTRHVGTDGGRTLHWSGKVGLIAGCTPSIDRHHAVMAGLGERFALVRLPELAADKHAQKALGHSGSERQMRAELSEAVTGLINAAVGRTPRARTEEETERLVTVASFVTKCRSAVERDSYSRDIELIPDSEVPTRLALVLDRLLAGLDVLGVDRARAWSVVAKVALDSMPQLRRKVVEALHQGAGQQTTTAISETLQYPTQTVRRSLEDLAAHGVVQREAGGKGKADLWRLADWARDAYDVTASLLTVPEMSEDQDDETFPETSEHA